MRHTTAGIVVLVIMVALIVGLDVAFLRDRLLLRLIVNVCIVVAFGAVYLVFRRRQ